MAEELEQEAPEVEVKPQVDPEVAALKGKLAQVQAKNAAEAAARKELAERLSAFEGVDPEVLPKMREAWESSQTAEERAESARKQMEDNAKRQREEFEQERKAWSETQSKERARLESAVLKDRVLAGVDGKKLQLEAGARESLLLHAERVFEVSEDMQTLSPRDVLLDEDNKEMSVEKWLDGLVATHGYLFKGGAGGGARPGGPGGGAKKKYVLASLTPSQRSAAIAEVRAGAAEWAAQ